MELERLLKYVKIFFLTIVYIVFSAAMLVIILDIFGYGITLAGCTGSMEPYITCGCPIIYKKLNIRSGGNMFLSTEENLKEFYKELRNYYSWIKEEVQVGDVISYRYKRPYYTLHRVVAKCENGVITKGDAVDQLDFPIDECIPYDAIIFKVVWKLC